MANGKIKSVLPKVPNSLESIKSIPTDAVKSLADKQWADDTFQQLLGNALGLGKSSGESAPPKADSEPKTDNTIFELFNASTHKESGSKKKSPEKKGKSESRQEAAMNYGGEIAKNGERASKSEVREMSKNIHELKAELHKLIESSKVLSMDFAAVTMEQTPTEVGKYHVNFFEWMLSVVRMARQKVEDSGAWLNTMKGKGKGKAKSQVDWSDTKVNQSNERNVATSVG